MDGGFDGFHNVNVVLLDLGGVVFGVGDDPVDVALEGVGAGFLDLSGVLDPSADRRAIEAGDNGDLHGGFGFADVLEIVVGAEVEFALLGEVA